VVEQLLLKIMKGEDGASVTLNKVFENSLLPTTEEFNKARIRKELGNPPGKPTDSLGDQVTWEQLLSTYDGASPLWIISNDNDYSSKVNKTRFLNSYLFNEIKKKLQNEPTIYIFETLAGGISHYSENRPEPVEHLPAKEELEKIAEKEIRPLQIYSALSGFPEPVICHKCSSGEGFIGPVPKPSRYGGWTYQWICKACGELHDFGEPYDE